MKKKCELCRSVANMYCESDSASLCWDCDAKVHSANFLVERHSRSLLCHVCSSPTAWSASGPSLSRTLSVCRPCCLLLRKPDREQQQQQEVEREFDSEDDYDDDDDDSEDEDEDDDQDDDDDEDEQVVPSPLASSSSTESSSKKRLRDFSSDDDFGCSSSHINAISFLARDSGASDCVDSFNCIKRLRTQSDKAEAVISDTLAVGSASDDSS